MKIKICRKTWFVFWQKTMVCILAVNYIICFFLQFYVLRTWIFIRFSFWLFNCLIWFRSSMSNLQTCGVLYNLLTYELLINRVLLNRDYIVANKNTTSHIKLYFLHIFIILFIFLLLLLSRDFSKMCCFKQGQMSTEVLDSSCDHKDLDLIFTSASLIIDLKYDFK